MSTIGTFGSFTMARLAIYTAQLGLSVTGNNISNVNTPGYTRQLLKQVSYKTGGADRYHSQYEMRIGNGVLPTGVSQLRDPYLDIRFRNDNSSVGAMDGKLSGLEKIAAILDEVGKGGDVKEGDQFGIIAYQIERIFQAISSLTDYTGEQEYDVQVRTAVESLCQEMRSYAAQLQELYDDTKDQYEQNIQTVNNLLTNIRDLNASIRKSEIHGDNALELRDQRNNLIDELSTYMKIDVIYTTEDIGAGQTVEKLIIKLGDANPDSTVTTDTSVLVNGRYCTQLGYTQVPMLNPDYDPDFDPTAPGADPDDIKQFEYLLPPDENGNVLGTHNEDEAARMDSPNFDLTLSELRDVFNDLYEEVRVVREELSTEDKFKEAMANGGQIVEDNGDGTFTVTTVRETWQKTLVYNDPPDPSLGTDENGDPYKYLKYKIDPTTNKPYDPPQYEGTNSPAEALRENKPVYYATVYIKTPSAPVPLDDNDLYGFLQAQREMLTEAGEFTSQSVIENVDENAAIKRGIPYYSNVLDLLAKQIAYSFNDYNKGYLMDNNGNYIQGVYDDDGNLIGGKPLTFTYQVLDENGQPIPVVDEDGNEVWVPKVGDDGKVDMLQPTPGTGLWETLPDGTPVTPTDEHGSPLWVLDEDGIPVQDEEGNYTPLAVPAEYEQVFETAEFSLGPDTMDTPWDEIPEAVRDIMTANDSTIDSIEAYLERGGEDGAAVGIFRGGNLFSNNGNSDDDSNITAANISVSKSWSRGPMIVNSFVCPPGEANPASTDSSNVLRMQGLQSKRLDYYPTWVIGDSQEQAMFTGSFSEMWRNIGTTLGEDQKITSTLLDNYYQKTVELDSSRAATSSVDFNDEAMNLMQYSKSYNAACRLMTTLDSVLDKLINGTGLTT